MRYSRIDKVVSSYCIIVVLNFARKSVGSDSDQCRILVCIQYQQSFYRFLTYRIEQQGSKIAKGHQSFKVFSSTALKFFLKSLTAPKIERGDPLGFFYTQSVAKPKKNEGGTLWGNFFSGKKSQCRKKLKGDPLVSSGIVCYAGNFLVLFPGPTGEI